MKSHLIIDFYLQTRLNILLKSKYLLLWVINDTAVFNISARLGWQVRQSWYCHTKWMNVWRYWEEADKMMWSFVWSFAIHRTNRRYILRCSKHVYRPLHKIWHGTVCFCAAAAYKLSHNQSIFKCLLLMVDTCLHSSNTVPILFCFVPSFVFHLVALQQPDSDLMYKSDHRCQHGRL